MELSSASGSLRGWTGFSCRNGKRTGKSPPFVPAAYREFLPSRSETRPTRPVACTGSAGQTARATALKQETQPVAKSGNVFRARGTAGESQPWLSSDRQVHKPEIRRPWRDL